MDELELNLVPKKVYKIYDKANAGRIVHSFARFDGVDKKKGNTFTLINRRKPEQISFTNEQMNNLILTTQPVQWKLPRIKRRKK